MTQDTGKTDHRSQFAVGLGLRRFFERGGAPSAAGAGCARPEQVPEAFREAFARIKASDAVVVGVFQGDKNQLADNAVTVRAILGG